jgi:hypothetical protein
MSAIRFVSCGHFPIVRNTLQGTAKIWEATNVELNKQGAGTIMMSELGVTYDSMFDDTGKQMTVKTSLWRDPT